MKLVLIVIITSVIAFGILVLPQSFGQQATQSHPLTDVTKPQTVGNGTVFQPVIIFNTKPVQDVGLAEYNKAINFEKVKTKILNATFSNKVLNDITTDVEKQRSVLLTEGTSVKRYYTNGSTTLAYSNWWMQSYVISRLDEDGLKAISSSLTPQMSLQDAIDPIDKEMQRIITNYNLNYTAPVPKLPTSNVLNSTTQNLTKSLSISNAHQPILNMTKNITSTKASNNNHATVANASKVTSSVPEFGILSGMIIAISVIGAVMISRRAFKL